jgi:hypothetical protein
VHHAGVIHEGMLIHGIDESEPAPIDAQVAWIRSADDLSITAYVETRDPAAIRQHLSARGGDPGVAIESATVRYDSPTRVVIEARLARPGIVVLADAYDPGWRSELDGAPTPVLRANLLMRAAIVPAGRHRLVYTYDPPSVRIGAFASLLGLAAIAGLAFRAHRRDGCASRLESAHVS